MRIITVLATLCLIMPVYAQKQPRKQEKTLELPFDTLTKRISYTEIVYADSMTAEQLYNRSLEWLAIAYKSANDVIQMKNEKDNKIIAKGSFKSYVSLAGLAVIECTVYHAVNIQCKPGRVRIQITDLYEKHWQATGNYTGEWVELGLEEHINPEYFPKAWTEFLTTVDSQIRAFLNQFSEYIQEPTKYERDDW